MRKQTTRNLRRAAAIGLAGLMLFFTGCGKKKVEETTIAETTKAPETLPPPTTAAETEQMCIRDRYNTLHFASQSCVPNGGVAPFGNPHKKRRYATPPRGAYRLFLLSSPPAVSVEQKSAWEWCGIFI